MKPTGIVRRVDDLGRIVIPKEIRKRFKISEGTPLEILIDDKRNRICFQRYDSVNDVSVMLEFALDAVTEDSELLKNSSKLQELRDKIVDVLEYSQELDKKRGEHEYGI